MRRNSVGSFVTRQAYEADQSSDPNLTYDDNGSLLDLRMAKGQTLRDFVWADEGLTPRDNDTIRAPDRPGLALERARSRATTLALLASSLSAAGDTPISHVDSTGVDWTGTPAIDVFLPHLSFFLLSTLPHIFHATTSCQSTVAPLHVLTTVHRPRLSPGAKRRGYVVRFGPRVPQDLDSKRAHHPRWRELPAAGVCPRS